MSRFRLNRRTMLRGLGTAIALPVLDAMLDSHGLLLGTAQAAGSAPPVRLFLVFFPCGTNMGRTGDSPFDLWSPPVPGADPAQTVAALTQYTSYPLSPILQSLTPIVGDVNVIGGIENTATRDTYHGVDPGCGHKLGSGVLFNGMPPQGQFDVGGPSVDQVAVKSLGLDTVTRYPSVSAGQPLVNTTAAPSEIISWRGPGAPVPHYSDPKKLFQALFGGVSMDVVLADDKSVLDYVMADVTRLKTRLGKRDQVALDEHLASLRGAEHALSTVVSCATPGGPNPTYGDSPLQSYDLRTPDLVKLLVLALQCDITRIVTLSLGPAGDLAVYKWLGQTLDHHSISHQPGPYGGVSGQIQQYSTWEVQQFVSIVQALKNTPDTNGTLLDNSIVIMLSEVADGNAHNFDNLPILMAGKCGGRIQTGRYIVYPYDTNVQISVGTPLNKLWLTVLQGLGANATSFGVDGTSTLPGLLS